MPLGPEPLPALEEIGRIRLTAMLLEGNRVHIVAESSSEGCPLGQYAKALGGIAGVCASGMNAVVEQCREEYPDAEDLLPVFKHATDHAASQPTKFTQLHPH